MQEQQASSRSKGRATRQLIVPLSLSAIALAVTVGVAIGSRFSVAQAQSSNRVDDLIANPSNPAQIALAEHLAQSGAKMYGAYWCPHCTNQKRLFGREAARQLPYIECDAQGENPQPALCQAANIRAFPTWIINGELYLGTQSLEKLATLSGYRGSRNF
ncbi:MAG: hypothetical protein LRZ84_09070 [Desertifilum sp.]|nr:hypothetical protein [Desertifilum sp.]